MPRPVRARGVTQAVRRPLRIFSSDPLAGRTFGNRARVEVANEPLRPGPVGARVEVVDYDGARDVFYQPVDLDDDAILMQSGLDPSESDPRFHQQMVYAVAMRTIENFDHALGRPVRLSGVSGGRARAYPRLRLFPHAFYGANAFYDRSLNAILFGYFCADTADPGPNLPGQRVFTCLSHDIIVHETTHALVDRLRPLFLEPTNEDALAFHEAFADLVALFQHFTYPEVVRACIEQTRSDIRTPTPLVELARQFGYATGTGRALRSAIDREGSRLRPELLEPHDRGAVLVAAVFGGFAAAYQRRIADLIRIATGGTGVVPSGALPPDLVGRLAGEASKLAQRVLDMCVRAFAYLPPMDVEFGDFLRALVTADFELVPGDPDLRDAMTEAFRLRGIFPAGVTSLAEESLLWPAPPAALRPLDGAVVDRLPALFFETIRTFEALGGPGPAPEEAPLRLRGRRLPAVRGEAARSLYRWALPNRGALGLDPGRDLYVLGFDPVFRVAPNGRLLIELVAQIVQDDPSLAGALGGVPFRGGATLIAATDGTIRYLIQKPFHRGGRGDDRARARARLERQRGFARSAAAADARAAYLSAGAYAARMACADFRALHGG